MSLNIKYKKEKIDMKLNKEARWYKDIVTRIRCGERINYNGHV